MPQALGKNIKKFFVEKLVDIAEILILLVLLFYVTTNAFMYGAYVGYGVLAAVLIGFYFMSRYTTSAFEKWEAPKMGREDEETYLLIDTFYTLILVGAVTFFLWPYVNGYILIGIFAVMVIIKEYKKWKRFEKEDICSDCGKPLSGPAGNVKEGKNGN